MAVKKRLKHVQIVALNSLKDMEEKMVYRDINVTPVKRLLVQGGDLRSL